MRFLRIPKNYEFSKGTFSNVLHYWFLGSPPQKFPALKHIETNNISYIRNWRQALSKFKMFMIKIETQLVIADNVNSAGRLVHN